MKIYFATSRARQKNETLNEAGTVNRLISFWYSKDSSYPDFIEQLARNGMIKQRGRFNQKTPIRKRKNRPRLRPQLHEEE